MDNLDKSLSDEEKEMRKKIKHKIWRLMFFSIVLPTGLVILTQPLLKSLGAVEILIAIASVLGYAGLNGIYNMRDKKIEQLRKRRSWT